MKQATASERIEEHSISIQIIHRKLETDLNNAYELSNLCIANRLKLHEEKQIPLAQLQGALRLTKMLEE